MNSIAFKGKVSSSKAYRPGKELLTTSKKKNKKKEGDLLLIKGGKKIFKEKRPSQKKKGKKHLEEKSVESGKLRKKGRDGNSQKNVVNSLVLDRQKKKPEKGPVAVERRGG